MSDDTSTADAGLDIDDATAEQLLADPPAAKSDTGDSTDWQAEAKKLQAEASKWQNLARKHESRAKENAQAAQKAKTVEQQLEELRGQIETDREKAVERNGKLALAQLNTRLAEAGIKRGDVEGLLKRIKATDLLADGEPSDEAIGELADSLVKITGRASPDPDQGQKGGKAPLNMNQLIRRAAGISS